MDWETTGLNKLEDNITEIGAIKIIEGRIEEEFHTLVNPLKPIPEEVVQKTGITDEMVKDSPNIETVFPDLIKYIDGATIVCHNADFDCSFIKRIAEKDNYEFNHEILDTVDISRRLVKGLKNYKLNTVCDYFKISFHHHRALSDAYATAELFIELAKIEEQKEN